MAPCRETVSCFASFQEEVSDQGRLQNSTSTFAQGHFSRECVYPQKVMNCRWRTTCCSLYHPAAYTSWTLRHKKQIYPLFSSPPLLLSCHSALSAGNEVIDSISNHAATQRQLLHTCFLWRTYRGIKFTLCVSQLSYNPHTNTPVGIHV